MVTFKMLQSAVDDVRKELSELGLLTKKLDEVDVVLMSPFFASYPLGYFFDGTNFIINVMGFEKGNIYIPRVTLVHLARLFGFGGNFSLRHVLRHEYGHALAYKHPALIRRSRDFTAVFGGRYDRETHVEEYNPFDFATPYAATKPAEDFAETFALYVRSKGDITNYLYPTGLFFKLSFVSELKDSLVDFI